MITLTKSAWELKLFYLHMGLRLNILQSTHMIRGKQCIKRLLADMEYLAKFIKLIIMSKVHA
jgi:hypothetical protein